MESKQSQKSNGKREEAILDEEVNGSTFKIVILVRIAKVKAMFLNLNQNVLQVVLEGACTGEPACIIAVDDVNLETGTCKCLYCTHNSIITFVTLYV